MISLMLAVQGCGAGCVLANSVQEKLVVTEVTNSWDTAVSLHGLGEHPINSYMMWSLGMCATNGVNYIISSVYLHECPKCTKPHLPDWPKTNVVTRAVQKRTEAILLRGTNELVRTERYGYPHTKIIETTMETLEIKTNVVKDVTAVQEPVVVRQDDHKQCCRVHR